jgi:Flp pilus assembly protein CpaB
MMRLRRGAINASTVFAVILAILAGLIFAWVFKVAFLDRKPAPKPPEEKRIALTVAAVNIPDKTLVTPAMVKTIRLTQAEYEERLPRSKLGNRMLLTGNQPVGRTTETPIRAEEPMFDDQFEPFHYPRPVSEYLAPGKQSVIVEVPADTTMVQRGDYVDVMCSLGNEKAVFGPAGSSATAILAKGRKVIARFHTTATAGRPPAGDMWPYTLEVEPWQAAAIELARKIGGKFALAVSAKETPTSSDGIGVTASVPVSTSSDQLYKAAEARYAETNRFTVADLAALFGVEEPEPEQIYRLERLIGNQPAGVLEYTLPAQPASTGNKSGKSSSNPRPRVSSAIGTGSSARTTAKANLGFQSIEDPDKECKTCAKKQ